MRKRKERRRKGLRMGKIRNERKRSGGKKEIKMGERKGAMNGERKECMKKKRKETKKEKGRRGKGLEVGREKNGRKGSSRK